MKKVKLLNDEFYDRDTLRARIKKGIEKNQRVILIKTSPTESYGLTYLLKYLTDSFKHKSLYIDMTPENNLAKQLYIGLKNEPKSLLTKIGHISLYIFVPILCAFGFNIANISFALGGFFQKSLENAKEITNCDGCLSKMSHAVMKICKRRTKKQKLMLVIDNAENLGKYGENVQLLENLSKNNNLIIILGGKESINLEKIYIDELDPSAEYKMTSPDVEYLSELGKKYNKEFTQEEQKEIVANVRDVYKISKIFRGQEDHLFKNSLNGQQKYIINLVKNAKIKLTENEVISIASRVNISTTQTKEDVSLLVKHKFIERKDNLLIFNKLYEDEFSQQDNLIVETVIEALLNKYAENPFSLNEERIEYILLNSHNRNQVQLLNIQRDLLKRSLQKAFRINDSILYSMNFDDDNSNLLLSIAFFNLREYKQARRVLEKIVERDGNYNIMNVLLLNRERHYEETVPGAGDGAIVLLGKLCADTKYSQFSALYNAVYAVSLLHANKMSEFDKTISTCLKTSGFAEKCGAGYFYRNVGLSVNCNNQISGLNMFDKAERIFTSNEDNFGLYTNKIHAFVYKMIYVNISIVDEKEFKATVEKIADFGTQHLHVALNNLALFYILRNKTGDMDKAKLEIEKAKIKAYDDMPKVFIGINEALIYVRRNDFAKAYETIINYESLAEEAKFTRIKQKYYLTKAFIAWLNSDKNVSEIIKTAMLFPERRNPEATKIICKKLKSSKTFNQTDLKDYILPAYLEYWYINPLKFINITAI